MKNLTFRTLMADEIECRVQSVKQNGLVLLLYKDARADMNLLDETVGCMNWQKSYSRDNKNCTVSIYDDDKNQWISKEDTGTESNTEAEKGLASDSFKRACFNWGIGRELYTAPFVWIPADKCTIKNINGRFACYDKFTVSEIEYDMRRRIVRLVIKNAKTGAVVFTYGKTPVEKTPAPKTPVEKNTAELREMLKNASTIFGVETGIEEEYVCKKHRVKRLEDLTAKQTQWAIDHFDKIEKAYLDDLFVEENVKPMTPEEKANRVLPPDCIHV